MFAAVVAEYFFLTERILRNGRALHSIVYASGFLVSFYSIISVALMYLDCFSVDRALYICAGAGVLFYVLAGRRKIGEMQTEAAALPFLLAFFVLALPLVIVKGETVRLGSDVGYYAEKAVDLMLTDTASIKVLAEFETVPPAMQQGLAELQSLVYFDRIPDTSGSYIYMFHGLSGWPAVMALFGKVFGTEHMFLALTVLFFMAGCALCLFICDRGPNTWSALTVLPFFLLSPVMIYLAKMSFSEMQFIAVLSIGALMLADTGGNRDLKICLAGVLFASLETVHISTFMYIPALFAVFMILGTLKETRAYFRGAEIMLVLFVLLFHVNYRISYIYVRDILCAQFTGLADAGKILTLLSAFFLALAVFSVFYSFLLARNQKIREVLVSFFENRFTLVLKAGMAVILLYTLFQAYRLGFTDKFTTGTGSWAMRSSYGGKGFGSLLHLNMTSFIMGFSLVGLPIILLHIFCTKELTEVEKLLYCMLEFTLLIYTVIRCDTPSNYYSSRYYALFLYPAGILILGLALSKMKCILIVCLLAMAFDLPFDLAMKDYRAYQGTDLIRKSAMQIIPHGAPVFLEPDKNLANILLFNLKEMNANRMYNLEDYAEGEQWLRAEDRYIVTSSALPDLENKLILSGRYGMTSDIADFSSLNRIVLFPLKFQEEQKEYFIYRINGEPQ